MPHPDPDQTTAPPSHAAPSRVPGVLAGRTWRTLTALRVARPIDDVTLPPAPHHTILVNVGRPFRLEERVEDQRFSTRGRPGDVAVIPAGMSASFRTLDRSPADIETFALLLDPSLVETIAARAGADPGASPLVGSMGGRDPAVERMAATLALELDAPGPADELYVDALATALAAQLLRAHTGRSPHQAEALLERPAGRLSPRQLRDVTDYVDANLDQPLALADLAGVAFLSPFHFARLFRASTGYSPHQFVLLKRVERARHLLATTSLPLADVALLSGFADQSHLAKHTRRLLGLTPTALRALTD